MRIGILGTGVMASALAEAWTQRGHHVLVGGRSQDKARAIAERLGDAVEAVGPVQVARASDAVVVAVAWEGLDQVLALAEADEGSLAGKAVRQLLQSVEPLLLCCGHTAITLRSVPGAPITDERPAHQQHRGNPVRVRQAEPARQVSTVGVSNQHGLGHVPCVEQLSEIVDVPGEGMASPPWRPARAALVVPVHGRKVRDHGGYIAQVVRQTRTAMEHDHGRPPGGISQRHPAQLRLVRHRHEALRLHRGHRGEPTGLTEALPKVK